MKVYDSDIRALLFRSFLLTEDYITSEDTIVINEMDVCAGLARADIAVVNGKIHGYEIKSQQDNLERLSSQIDFYNQVFDTMRIVAFDSHIEKIENMVPEWWGINRIIEKNGQIQMEIVREGSTNIGICLERVAMLLWREEMIELLSSFGGVTSGIKSKSRYQLSKIIALKINGMIITDFVRETLKARSDWKAVHLRQLNDDLHNSQPIMLNCPA